MDIGFKFVGTGVDVLEFEVIDTENYPEKLKVRCVKNEATRWAADCLRLGEEYWIHARPLHNRGEPVEGHFYWVNSLGPWYQFLETGEIIHYR